MAVGAARVRIDWTKAKEFGLEVADKVAEQFAKNALREAVHTAPRRSGHLARSHKILRVRIGEFVVLADASYSLYVHEGTGVHHAGGRRTPWTYYDPWTKRFYTTRGQKPNRWLTRALDIEVAKWQ